MKYLTQKRVKLETLKNENLYKILKRRATAINRGWYYNSKNGSYFNSEGKKLNKKNLIKEIKIMGNEFNTNRTKYT
jgi:hypothetical protein